MPDRQKISKDFLHVEGVVEELLPSTTFRVILDNGKSILAHLSGKMRMYRIRISQGDKVKLEISPYDLTKGRIVYRLKIDLIPFKGIFIAEFISSIF